MKLTRFQAGLLLGSIICLASPRTAEAHGGGGHGFHSSGHRYGGGLGHNHQPNVWFRGRIIDPRTSGPTIDGVEIDVPRLTAEVQRRLAARRFYSGPANGQMSPAFVQALRRFQAENYGRSTGLIDSSTLEDVGLSAAQFAK